MRNFTVALWWERAEAFCKSPATGVCVYFAIMGLYMLFSAFPRHLRVYMSDGFSFGEFVSWLIQ